jgi:superfamily I DNA and RNA helicase
MAQGQPVILARTSESSPAYLEEYLNNDTDEIISFTVCNDKTDQAKKVARSIFKNIKEDELLYKDIIVINPEALTTKDEVAIIRELLHMAKINTHIAGEFDQDVFFQDDSITFTGINRAKGNEVPMVYIINANYCFEGSELRKKRNILFTAITRSKAWVKVFGIGTPMQELREEFHKVKKNSFTLSFTYPTRDQIKKMNVINRDLSETEKQSIQKEVTAITDIVEKIKAGKSLIEDYPEWIQDMLKLILK